MNSSAKRLSTVAAALVLAAFAAQAKPNFTGEWKLNPSKSEFGQMPAPSSMVQKMTHDEPNLKVSVKQTSDMGEFAFDATYTTDGKESTNTMMDSPSKSVVTWDGDTLLIETKGKFGDSEFKMNDKWTVSADGKVLTINRHFTSSFGEGDQKMVLEKQ
jgi:hypothetical protein